MLKANPDTAGIPIWALTAHAMATCRDEAIEAGCTAYVTKPVDVTALAERLRTFVRAAVETA